MRLAQLNLLVLLLAGVVLANSGCALVAAGAAGGVAATEMEENDNDFDPLENTKVGQDVHDAGQQVKDSVEDAVQ